MVQGVSELNRKFAYHALLVIGWLLLTVYGHHLEVRFFAAFCTGVNVVQALEAWKKDSNDFNGGRSG
jgi:hypothetical protein